MWWLLIPAAIVLGTVVFDALTEESEVQARQKSTLDINLERLERQLYFQAGYKVAILGQPGAGKSSLLKGMTKGKVTPIPVIGNQTDATNWAKDTKCELLSYYQTYIFADAPGYDTVSHPVSAYSSSFPFARFDAILFVVHGKLHDSDEKIFRCIIGTRKPVCIVRSFAESLDQKDISLVENDIRRRLLIDASVPIIFMSNRTGAGIENVFNFVFGKATH